MSGCVDEAQAMARVRKKRGSRFHRGQMTAFAFAPQFLLDAALLSHQTDQRFRLMRVELIGDKDPDSFWIGLDGLGNVGSKVGFGACWSQARADHLTSRHLQIGDQTHGAMPLVFEFEPLHMTGQHRQRGVETLQCLDSRHLIGTHHMRTLRRKHGSGFIDVTHGADLLGQRRRIVGRRRQPVALAMGL